jgi:hypothetical protein
MRPWNGDRLLEESHEEGGSGRQLIAVIVLGGLWLSGALHRSDTVQDCAMSGRTNCAPVEAQH